MSNQNAETVSLLAIGAHPDDIEFGCGGVVAQETRAGQTAHLVVCSRGEAGTNGNPDQRTKEAESAAALLGASLEFTDLGSDSHFECSVANCLKLAAIFRRIRPSIVLAPSLVGNQHPDHSKLGRMVRDSARLARYGGVKELVGQEPHAIKALLYYAITAEAEPGDLSPVLVDVSDPQTIEMWKESMEAHASQLQTRRYVKLQLARAELHGARCGVSHAIPLFPNDPLVVGSLAALNRTARRF